MWSVVMLSPFIYRRLNLKTGCFNLLTAGFHSIILLFGGESSVKEETIVIQKSLTVSEKMYDNIKMFHV